jgi:Protein of unknown function (DUF3575)
MKIAACLLRPTLFIAACFFAFSMNAQEVAVSTNIGRNLLGKYNLEIEIPVTQRFSITAAAEKWNVARNYDALFLFFWMNANEKNTGVRFQIGGRYYFQNTAKMNGFYVEPQLSMGQHEVSGESSILFLPVSSLKVYEKTKYNVHSAGLKIGYQINKNNLVFNPFIGAQINQANQKNNPENGFTKPLLKGNMNGANLNLGIKLGFSF